MNTDDYTREEADGRKRNVRHQSNPRARALVVVATTGEGKTPSGSVSHGRSSLAHHSRRRHCVVFVRFDGASQRLEKWFDEEDITT